MKITRTQQPQGGAQIDWANPITKGLTVSLPLNSNNFQSLGLNKVVGTPLNASQGVSKAGTHLKLAGTGYVSLGTTCLLPSASTPFTLTLYELPSSVTTYSSLLALSGGTQQWLWIRGSHSSYLCAIGRSSSGVLNFNSVGAPVVGVGRRFVITSQNGIEGTNTGYRLWMDGVEQTSLPTTFGSIASSTNYIGWDSGAEDKWNGGLQDFNLWSRVLSDAEIASYFRNPWQLFSKIDRPIFVGVGAGSGGSPYTLTAEAGAFAITGSAANLAFNRTFTADAGALAISGNAATVSLVVGVATFVVTSDATASYLLRTSASSDTSASYAIAAPITSDTSAAYAICEAVALDTTSSYLLRTSASSDTSASYAIAAPVTSDTSASYSILTAGAVTSDTASTYSIRGVVQSDASVSYELHGAVQASMGSGYDIRQAVVQDASAAYLMRGAVESDLAAAYAVLSLTAISADLAASYTVTGVPGVSGLSEADIAAIWAYSSRTLTSTTPTAADIAAQVRIELAAELAKIDAAISTRATPASVWAYTQ